MTIATETIAQAAAPEPACFIQAEQLTPRAAAVELLPAFKNIAIGLCAGDKSTQDDLVQEMCLAAIQCPAPHPPKYFLWLGAQHARNYLWWWFEPMRKNINPEHIHALRARGAAR